MRGRFAGGGPPALQVKLPRVSRPHDHSAPGGGGSRKTANWQGLTNADATSQLPALYCTVWMPAASPTMRAEKSAGVT